MMKLMSPKVWGFANPCSCLDSLSLVLRGEGWDEGRIFKLRSIPRLLTLGPSPQPSPLSTREREKTSTQSKVKAESTVFFPANMHRPYTAFTLIEVMLVVAIMAILTAAAALTFAGPLRKAQSQEAAQQLRFFDASARDLARRWGREVQLSFDLDRQILSRMGGPGSEQATYRTSLPRGTASLIFARVITLPKTARRLLYFRNRAWGGPTLFSWQARPATAGWSFRALAEKSFTFKMNRNLMTSSNRSHRATAQARLPFQPMRRKAVTLIEVLCGLVILGTVLASLSIARGRFLRQWGDAERKLQATRALDQQIDTWLSATPTTVPFAGRGSLNGVNGGWWQTRRLNNPGTGMLGASVVRVEAFSPGVSNVPVATVDLLVHNPPPTTRPIIRGGRDDSAARLYADRSHGRCGHGGNPHGGVAHGARCRGPGSCASYRVRK